MGLIIQENEETKFLILPVAIMTLAMFAAKTLVGIATDYIRKRMNLQGFF